jgi:hypothetical protein
MRTKKEPLPRPFHKFLFGAHFLHQLGEDFRLVDSHFGKRLAVELDALLVELIDENAVLAAGFADGCVQTNDPERAEVALLLLTVHVCMLTGFDDALLCLYEGGVAKTLIALSELLDLLVPAVTDDAAFYTHDRERK